MNKLLKQIEHITNNIEFLVEYPNMSNFKDHGYSVEETEAFLKLILTAKKINPQFNDTLYCNNCGEEFENRFKTIEVHGLCSNCEGNE